MADKPNILFLVMDSVRAPNTSLHDYHRKTTPFLSKFAKSDAMHFTQARAPGIWSLPSHTSMFTGLHVEEHGVTSLEHTLQPGNSIWEELHDEYDYSTGVFSDNPFITDAPVGLSDCFQYVSLRPDSFKQDLTFPNALDPREFVRKNDRNPFDFLKKSIESGNTSQSLINGIVAKLSADYPTLIPNNIKMDLSASADLYLQDFIQWKEDKTGPWAACINFMDAHDPYWPKSEFDCWSDDKSHQLQSDIEDYVWEFNNGSRPWW